ncbi:MAG: hypothetical protein JW864_03640 [Spirochaetes bacterium]|nr:hypothetical protein [Spirochaetota bacterium]
MKTAFRLVIFIIISALSATLTTCNPGTDEKGALSFNLHFTDSNSEKTAIPDIDMSISYYDITLEGPDSESIFIGNSSGSETVVNLTSGEWTVSAIAVNSDNLQIGTGSESVEILARKIVSCEIIVSPYDGFGGLQLNITWDGTITDSRIEGNLDPAIGTVDPVDFTLDSGVSYYENTSLTAGYYIMTIKLFNSSIECGGAVEVLRIVADDRTKASLHIQPSSGDGGAGVAITPEMNDPVEIVLSGGPESVQYGNSFTISAEAVNASDVIYSWFIDGSLMESGASYNSYSVPVDLAAGFHRLDIVIFTIDGLRGGSASHIFEVTE